MPNIKPYIDFLSLASIAIAIKSNVIAHDATATTLINFVIKKSVKSILSSISFLKEQLTNFEVFAINNSSKITDNPILTTAIKNILIVLISYQIFIYTKIAFNLMCEKFKKDNKP